MIKNLPPPTETEEYRNTAEILRDLAAQARFSGTRNELFNYADNLDRLAARAERQSEATLQTVPAISRQLGSNSGRPSAASQP
jgi:hypothetical protein